MSTVKATGISTTPLVRYRAREWGKKESWNGKTGREKIWNETRGLHRTGQMYIKGAGERETKCGKEREGESWYTREEEKEEKPGGKKCGMVMKIR